MKVIWFSLFHHMVTGLMWKIESGFYILCFCPHILHATHLMKVWTLHENMSMKIWIFVLPKFVKRAEKIIFSLVFVCFRFTEISYFLSFPWNENVKKQYLSANAYFCVNMKLSYIIAGRKDEIFYDVL